MNFTRLIQYLGGLAMLAASPAMAEVYQLDDGGVVQVRRGGGAVSWQAASTSHGNTSHANSSRASYAPVTTSTTVESFGATSGDSVLEQAAAQAGLHPALLEALVWQESRWHPNAISRRGAVGLTQLMPGTARDLGVDPYDPVANLYAGARHLRSLLDHFNGDLVKALAAYNAGVRRVEQAGGIPPIRETQNYVAGIISRLDSTMANH